MASLTQTDQEANTLADPAASTAITSLENNSTDTPSSAAPIIIGASVASVVLVVLLIFVSIWYRRRRSQHLERAFINRTFPPQPSQIYRTGGYSNYPLHTVSKLDFLPPEPEAPPPYGKDSLDDNDDEDKDLEAGVKPPTPPKDMGRTYVRTRGLSGASTPWGSRPASRPASRPISRDGIPYPLPVRNWQEGAAF